MKKFTFLFMVWHFTISSAQVIPKEDASRFEDYFFDSIAISVDFPLMSSVYQKFSHQQRHEIERTFSDMRSWNYPKENLDGTRLLNSREETMDFTRKNLHLMYKRLHTPSYDVEADKQRAKQLIKQFRTEATVLPTFYQLIDKKYKGDVDRYVDDLFNNSFMGNKKVLDKLMKKPTLKKLREDPAVLYTISKMQYLALIKLGEMEQDN